MNELYVSNSADQIRDDMHLGPTAHRAFGKQLATMLHQNSYLNAEVRSRNITEEGQRPMQLVRYIPGLSPPSDIGFDVTHYPAGRRSVQAGPTA